MQWTDRVDAGHQHINHQHGSVRHWHSTVQNLFQNARVLLRISRTVLDVLQSLIDVFHCRTKKKRSNCFFIQLFNFLKNCLYSVKKSCAWNNFFIVGVMKNRHKNVTVISFKAVNEMLVASIIFCASESGARSSSKQPRRVLKLTTATATEFRNKNNFYIFYWILKLKFTFQCPAVHFIDEILVHFVVQFPDYADSNCKYFFNFVLNYHFAFVNNLYLSINSSAMSARTGR